METTNAGLRHGRTPSKDAVVLGIRDRCDLILRLRSLLPRGADFFLLFQTDRPVPSLCAGWIEGRTETPHKTSDVEETLKRFQAGQTVREVRLGQYVLFLNSGDDALPKGSLSGAGHLLNTFLFDSLAFYNSLEDQISRRLENFNFLDEQQEPVGHEIFLGMLRDCFSVTGSVFRLVGDRIVHESQDCAGPLDDLPLHLLLPKIREALGSERDKTRSRVIEVTAEDKDVAGQSILEQLFNDREPTDQPEAVYIFPIRAGPLNAIRTNEFVLLIRLDGRPMSLAPVMGVDQCVEAYIHTRTAGAQQECLLWQGRAMTSLIASLSDTRASYDAGFEAYLRTLGGYVIRSTQAHSFAYLAYDAATKGLVRTVAVNDSDDDEMPSLPAKQRVTLRQTENYLSANLFMTGLVTNPEVATSSRRDFVHVGKINSKEARKDAGIGDMAGLECGRNRLIESEGLQVAKTVSEVAMLVMDQGVPIGVLCVECPYVDGLKADENFLRQVANNASIFWSLQHRVSDQLWLRRNLELQDVSHQLVKLIDGLPAGKVKDRLEVVAQRLDPTVLRNVTDGEDFEKRLEHLISREAGGSSIISSRSVSKIVQLFLEDDLIIRSEIASAALTIVSNLVRNRVYARDEVRISITTRADYRGLPAALVIKTVLDFSGPQSEVIDAFRRPIVRPDREHVGLYLIGVVARTWGGRLSFDRRKGLVRRALEVCLPIEDGRLRADVS